MLALSNILRDNVATLDKAAALSVTSPFLAYFLEAFKYRKQMAPKALLAEKDIILVEDELIETFMTLSLKLSLDDFKPMFYRYYFNIFFISWPICSLNGGTQAEHNLIAMIAFLQIFLKKDEFLS